MRRGRDSGRSGVSAETPGADPLGTASLRELVRAAAIAEVQRVPGAGTELVRRIAARWDVDGGGRAEVEAMLATAANDAWARGFEPVELARFVKRRLDADAAELVAMAIAADAERYRDRPDVDPSWLAQVDGLRKRRAKPGWLDAWAQRQPHLTVAARSIARLVAVLDRLPRLDHLGSEPGGPFRRRAGGGLPSDIDPKVLSRVRALLAKAESTNFPEEAEALMAKAQELMARHAIDQALLDAGGSGRGDKPTSRRIAVDDPYAAAKTILLTAVARASRCHCIWMKDIGSCVVFGFPADLAAVDLLFTSLLAQAATAMHSVRPDGMPASGLRGFRQSFLVSYGERIGERLEAVTRKVVNEAAAVDDSLLPVLAARDDEVKDAFREAFPRSKPYEVSVNSRSGLRAGRDAADRADLGNHTPVPAAPRGAIGR